LIQGLVRAHKLLEESKHASGVRPRILTIFQDYCPSGKPATAANPA